jgi:hypothetical protein
VPVRSVVVVLRSRSRPGALPVALAGHRPHRGFEHIDKPAAGELPRERASQASIRSYYLAALSRLYEALVAPDSAGVAANLGVQRPYYGARSRFAAGSAGMSPR